MIKMYSLVIPEELVKEMYFIRKKTGKSIRKQILDSVKNHIEKFGSDKNVYSSYSARALQRTF